MPTLWCCSPPALQHPPAQHAKSMGVEKLTLWCCSPRPPSSIHLHSFQSLRESEAYLMVLLLLPPSSIHLHSMQSLWEAEAYLKVLLPRPPSSIHLQSMQSLWELRSLPYGAAPPPALQHPPAKHAKSMGVEKLTLWCCSPARPPASTCTARKIQREEKVTKSWQGRF